MSVVASVTNKQNKENEKNAAALLAAEKKFPLSLIMLMIVRARFVPSHASQGTHVLYSI